MHGNLSRHELQMEIQIWVQVMSVRLRIDNLGQVICLKSRRSGLCVKFHVTWSNVKVKLLVILQMFAQYLLNLYLKGAKMVH